MRTLIMTVLAALLALPALAADKPMSEEQKSLYAIGLIMARQLDVFALTPAEFELVKQGLADGMSGKPLVDADAYTKNVQELAIARRDARGQKLVAGAKEFIDKAAREKGAVRTASGLVFLSLREGSGAGPAIGDMVKAQYRGTFIDGKEFDSSYKRGQPAEFQLAGAVKCWTEGIQMMKPGGKARLVCPPETAFGKAGSGIIPANATLVYEIELLEVMK